MPGNTARQVKKVAVTVVARLCSHSAGETSSMARTRNVPTLLIRISTRPARAVTARTISCTAAGSRKSAGTANADPPPAPISSTTAAAAAAPER